MLFTTVLAAILLGLLLGSAALWALLLRLGLRWAHVPGVTTRRVILATIAALGLQVALNVLFLFASPPPDARLLVAVTGLAAAVAVTCLVIAKLFKTGFLRAFQAWLPTLLAPAVAVALVAFVVRPFLFEGFVAPTNAMAPTLLGVHQRGVCPFCGRPGYCSPIRERYGPPDPPLMICDGFHVALDSNVEEHVYPPDRFLVAKFLTPRRWDLVVFRYPEDPSVLYVKRLVGLPGETIQIKDGMVWANGKKLTPPDSIQSIEYLSGLPGWHGLVLWGSAERPASLAEDEYFVLGDFSAQSKDSRLWVQGAPGHNPFAVPESHMVGVVTHRYWPPARWQVLR